MSSASELRLFGCNSMGYTTMIKLFNNCINGSIIARCIIKYEIFNFLCNIVEIESVNDSFTDIGTGMCSIEFR